ncbi:MAG: hypothetical protein U5N58_13815 [Actinomycetota bacterium]|nr:hypothetical protein [Actinomycetota bacterium]
MVEEGIQTANMTAPVNIQGIMVFDFLWNNITGAEVDDPEVVPLPVIPVGQDNI